MPRLPLLRLLSLLGLTLPALALANEPPLNPFVADSPWPMTHRNPYMQASSPLPGPTQRAALAPARHSATGMINITLAMSPLYPDGSRVAWGSNLTHVYKTRVDKVRPEVIDRERKPQATGLANAASGAYTMVDRDNVFYVPGAGALYAYSDSTPGDASSPVELLRTFTLPPALLNGTPKEDPIVGINMTWDGYIALATRSGVVMTVARDFSHFHTLKLGGAPGETLSNSIAVDENGGIYIVTSHFMYRVQWTGDRLTLDPASGAWQSGYENGADVQVPGRLGAGSGSTPTLMGTGDQDRFVVITDGQAVTHLTLFWRDAIPDDWQPIAPGKDRRIAAEMPVNYGDPNRPLSASEQSVLVRGYGAVVVSNDYGVTRQSANPLFANLINGSVVFLSNTARFAPYGVQKFEWNPQSRSLKVAWVNPDISCPNGIPTMSEPSNLFYCVGQRNGVWNFEALDWSTGKSRFYRPLSRLPQHNSFYASAQIGPQGDLWTGTLTGVVQVAPR